MEYQKIANLLECTSNNPSKFRTRNWVEIMMNQEETMQIVILDLKLQCYDQIYVVMLIHTYLSKEQ